MAILAVGLVGAMRVFPVGLRASRRAEQSSRAVLAAQRALEALKLSAWDALVIGQTQVTEDGFTVTSQITQPDSQHLVDPTRIKAIEVIVQWEERGRVRELVFMTYLRRDENDT